MEWSYSGRPYSDGGQELPSLVGVQVGGLLCNVDGFLSTLSLGLVMSLIRSLADQGTMDVDMKLIEVIYIVVESPTLSTDQGW